MTNEVENTKPTEQSLFDRFVNLYHEQGVLNQDIKALSEEYGELYPDADLTTIKAVAKAKSEDKLGNKIQKNKQFEEIAESFVK